MTESNEQTAARIKQQVVDHTSGSIALLIVAIVAVSATLTFWFALQFASPAGNQRTVLMAMAYISLIAAYYGIAPLSDTIQRKAHWALSKLLGTPSAAGSSAAPLEGAEGAEAKFADSSEGALDQGIAQIEQEPASNIQILIVRHDGAPNPDLPSHLFPGAGSDGASFEVQGAYQPTVAQIDKALNAWDGDCYLREYDEETRVGYFKMCDSNAPEAGTLIELKPFSW